MNDDELLRMLADAERRERAEEGGRLDDRWDRLAAGTLSDIEREQLLAETDVSLEKAAAYEAFRPLGAEFRARIAHELGAGIDVGATPPHEMAGESESPALVPDATPKVVPLRTRRTRWLPLAMAAGLFVAVGAFWTNQAPIDGTVLPGYSLSVQGGVKSLRGEDGSGSSDAMVLTMGNRLRLLLTPDTRVEGAVSARVYLERAGALELLQTPDPRVSPDGAVLIEGIVGDPLNVPPGRSSLIIIVGSALAMPDPEQAVRALGSRDEVQGDGWLAWRRRIVME